MAQHLGASRAGGSKQSTEESVDEMEGDEHEMNGGDGYGYGSTPGTPAMAMDAPVRALKDKWRLLPHFLAMRGLMKQHIGELRASCLRQLPLLPPPPLPLPPPPPPPPRPP